MLAAFISPNTVLALIVIIALLLMKNREQKKRIDVLGQYLREADEDLELKQIAARYWHHLLFAKLAQVFPSGLQRTQGGLRCFIDLPTGQISSWFAPDKNDPRLNDEDRATLDFETEIEIGKLYSGLPEYKGKSDGHSVEQCALRLGGNLRELSEDKPLPDIPLRA